MEPNKERRSFIGKMLLGIGSIVTIPLVGFAKSTNRQTKHNNMEKHPVLSIKPLGFQWETADPFLFCVHHEDFFPKGNEVMGPKDSLAGRHLGQDFIVKDGYRMYHGQRVPGFPGHPHRGFETVTVVKTGLVDHADSLGAAGRYGNGDVQWMTAGKGVQHSEMFPLLNEDKDNPLELFQIWLNLPKKNKMVEPHFKMLWNETIPVVEQKNANGAATKIEVIAGTFDKKNAPSPPPNSWASDTHNLVSILNITLDPNASFELPASEEGVNRTLYYYKGNNLTINNKKIPNYHAAVVDPTTTLSIENGNEPSKILLLQGKPISEPVVQHGPFVMNTREEIQEAFNDYHRTQFGGWPWPRYDQVHDRKKGRFALHADGTEEAKS